jgi:signal peptidase I
VIDGASMRPLFNKGDVAVVQQQSHYKVGDIVLYRSASLHRHVLHRIVGRRGNGYVVKGDANPYADPDHPTQAEIVGRYWFALPRVGTTLEWFRTPLHAGVLVFVAALIALLPTTRQQPERA